MIPRGNTFLLPAPPSNSLVSVSVPRLPRVLLPELKRYKDTVRCAALGHEVPGHGQEQLTQTLFIENALLYADP